jgi:trimeric autotransporter adhesin
MQKIVILFFFSLILISPKGFSQSLTNLKDIYAGTSNAVDGSEPSVAVGNNSYFAATNATTGMELWKTDGTTAGTVLLKDIFTGAADAYPSNLINVAGTLFFTADDGVNGIELWKTDGTNAGTVLVKNINTGISSSYPNNFLRVNNVLYFVANDGIKGYELWKTDGTNAGTVLVKDIYTGIDDAYPKNLTNVNGTIYFTATTAAEGEELWKTDGTTAGTVMVKDIETGVVGSSINQILNIANTIYFQAYTTTNGYDLWKSDGTAGGTVLLKDINSVSSHADISNMVNVNGIIYYRATDGTNGYELWKTDGTAAGTTMVKDISTTSYGGYPSNIIGINNTLYFVANDGINGYELWKSDGTTANTILVKDIQAGALGSFAKFLTNVNGNLFFVATTSTDGDEVWKSDGTNAGTVLLGNINTAATGATAQLLVNNNQQLYLQANEAAIGNEYWQYNACTNYTLATNGSAVTNAIEQGCNFIKNNTCQLITKIYQVGSTPLYNNVTAKVIIDAAATNYGGTIYAARHYDIQPISNASTATANVTLYFSQAEFTAYNLANGSGPFLPTGPSDIGGIANVTITQCKGTGTNPTNYTGATILKNPNDATIIWNATDSRWEITFPVVGLGGFFVRAALGVVPLNLINFTGTKTSNGNLLQWQTSNEVSTRRFEVERQLAGSSLQWATIASQNAIGNGANNYSFIDNDKMDGTILYRLKMIDVDGKFTYSNIIKLSTLNLQHSTLYPNPIKDKATLQIGDRTLLNTQANLFDTNGKIVKTISIKNNFEILDVSVLSSGLYMLKMSNGESVKIVKH